MTIFTVNPLNDNYLNQPFIKFCMKTWEKVGFPIKVFDYNSKEVKEAKEKYKIWYKNKPWAAFFFRDKFGETTNHRWSVLVYWVISG